MKCELCHGPIVHGDGAAPTRHLLVETCIKFLASRLVPYAVYHQYGADGLVTNVVTQPRPARRRKKG